MKMSFCLSLSQDDANCNLILNMGDAIEEVQVEPYQHVPGKLDIYACIKDIANFPDKAKARLQTIEDILKELESQDCLTKLVNGMYR